MSDWLPPLSAFLVIMLFVVGAFLLAPLLNILYDLYLNKVDEWELKIKDRKRND